MTDQITASPVLLGATPGVDIAGAVALYEATRRTAWEVYEATRRPAWEVYEATRRPAWEVYEATERTAWEVYEATERPAREVYEATRRTAWKVYEATERPAWEVYKATERTAWEVYEATRRTAWEQLLRDVADDPLAAWIVEHAMPTYPDQAIVVLKALPATLDQLDQLAEDNDWCDTWAEQVTAAGTDRATLRALRAARRA